MVEARHEWLNPPSYAGFRKALSVFSGDLILVNHPYTPTVSPFQQISMPLYPHHDNGRQYHLTQLLPWLNHSEAETDFLREFSTCEEIKIGCIDKDASGPSYGLYTNGLGIKVAFFHMAGGITQPTPNRLAALETMVAYLSRHGKHINTVWATNHNRDCGLITSVLGGGPENTLAKRIGAESGSMEENRAIKSMIKYYTHAVGLYDYFRGRVRLALELIDRKGHVGRDFNFSDIEPQSLAEVLGLPEHP